MKVRNTRFVGMAEDASVHLCRPSTLCGSADPRHFVPGVYVDFDSTTTHVWVVEPVKDKVAVYRIDETINGELQAAAYAGVPLPAAVAHLFAGDRGERLLSVDLTNRSMLLQLVWLRHMEQVAADYPASIWDDDGDQGGGK